MNRRWYWDDERGLPVIRRSPDAMDYPTPEKVKAWMGSGRAPMADEEPDDECGPPCAYCGGLHDEHWDWCNRPTGTEHPHS